MLIIDDFSRSLEYLPFVEYHELDIVSSSDK